MVKVSLLLSKSVRLCKIRMSMVKMSLFLSKRVRLSTILGTQLTSLMWEERDLRDSGIVCLH